MLGFCLDEENQSLGSVILLFFCFPNVPVIYAAIFGIKSGSRLLSTANLSSRQIAASSLSLSRAALSKRMQFSSVF